MLFLLVGTASALTESTFTLDKEKALEEKAITTKYGTYEIKEYAWYDILKIWKSETIKRVNLLENTESCSGNCYAIKEVENLEKGKLIEDVRFFREIEGEMVLWNSFVNWKILIEEDVDIYETNCYDGKEVYSEENKTSYTEQICEQVKVGTEKKWVNYDFNKDYEIGTYKIKLLGGKKPEVKYDWQVKINGIWTEEWAVWGYEGDLSDGLVSQYIFNDANQTILNDTIGSNDGTFTGYTYNNGAVEGATLETSGCEYGSCYSFDGVNDIITISADASLYNSVRTFSLWFNASSDGEGNLGRLWDKNGTIAYLEADAYISFNNLFDDGYTKHRVAIPSYNELHHLGYIYDNSDPSNVPIVYIDGSPVSVTTVTPKTGTAVSDVANDLVIGNRIGQDRTFEGSIDEVRIFNRALTQTEIQAEMNSEDPVKSDGLVSSYSFEQNNATHTFDTNNLVDGIIYEGGRFDGVGDYVSVPDSDSLDPTTEMSFSLWIKLNQLASEYGSDTYPLEKHTSGDTGWFTWFESGNDKFNIRLGSDSLVTSTAIPKDEWTLLTFSWNGTTGTVYVNGEYSNSGAMTSYTPSSEVLGIGAGNVATTPAGLINGSIDDVRIWNRSLSADEISALYNSGSGTEENTMGYITLNSPADSSTQYSNPITFNASANVTGGATLTNMSLWTNETGSWEVRNSSEDLFEGLNLIEDYGKYYYEFNERTGTTAIDYLQDTNGSISGNVTINETGYKEEAYDFYGGYVTIGSSSDSVFSVSAWVNREASANAETIWANGGAVMRIQPNGTLSCFIDDLSSNENAQSISTIPVGTWTHVGCSYDRTGSGKIRLYINGTSIINVSSTRTASAGEDRIGLRSAGSQPFYGLIDEVVIFDTQVNDTTYGYLYNFTEGTDYTKTFSNSYNAGDSILWNYEACDSDGDCGFATANRTFMMDNDAPTINISYPTTTLDYGRLNNNETLNVTITDTNLDTCWYNYNGTNITFSCSTGVLSSEEFNLTTESLNQEIIVYANDSLGNENSTTLSWEYRSLETSRTYLNETTGGTIETFSINITLNNDTEISSGVFHYNGENSTSEINSEGNVRILSLTFEIPSYTNETNTSFYWTLTFDDGTIFNTSTSIQTISPIRLDNCSTYTNQLFNLSLFDEELKTPINGTIELFYEIKNVPNYNTIYNLTGKFENISNTLVCSEEDLSGQNLVYSTEIRYSASNYSSELYHIQRGNISEPQNLSLFDLKSTDATSFLITYHDDNFIKVKDAIIQLQRKYISENIYEIVEAPLTSDDGTAVVHIDLDTNKYKVVVVKNGVILNIFDNIVFNCESLFSGNCEQKLYGTLDPQNEVNIENLVDFSYSISTENNTMDFIFSIPSGEPSEVNILLTQTDQFGNDTLCNRTIISSGGSTECTFNESIGNSVLSLTITKDGVPQVIKSYLVEEDFGLTFLNNNFFIVFIFLLSIIGMAFTSPEWIILNAVITMFIAGSLFLLNGMGFVVGLGGLMWLIIASAILIMKIAKQEDR